MSYFDSEFSEEGNLFSEEKNVDEEIKRCKELVDSGNIFNLMETAEEVLQLCGENERFSDGLHFVNLLLEVAPYNSDYWFKKGFFLSGLAKFQEAIECYDKSLSLNPGDSEILIDRASAEESLGLTAQARKSLEAALTGDPHNEDALFSLGVIHQQKEDLYFS